MAWESGLEITKDKKCPKIEEAEATGIVIPYNIWASIIKLTREVDTEWLGYFQASKLENGDWYVTELQIPEQEVTATTVTPKKTIDAPGVIHSHVDMSAYFSGTDDAYLNENHDFSIVVNRDADVAAVQRIKLPCGVLTVIETKVEVEHPEPKEQEEFIEMAKKKLVAPKAETKRTYPVRQDVLDYYDAWYYGRT